MHLGRGAEHQRRQRVVMATGIGHVAQVEGDEVGHHARGQGADVIAVEHLGAAQGGDFQRLAGGHRVGAEAHPLQQQGLAHLTDHAGAIVGRRTVDTQANRYTVVAHLAYRGDA
ncbi:hypothetical protein D9M71_735100 [compost metagenome]